MSSLVLSSTINIDPDVELPPLTDVQTESEFDGWDFDEELGWESEARDDENEGRIDEDEDDETSEVDEEDGEGANQKQAGRVLELKITAFFKVEMKEEKEARVGLEFERMRERGEKVGKQSTIQLKNQRVRESNRKHQQEYHDCQREARMREGWAPGRGRKRVS